MDNTQERFTIVEACIGCDRVIEQPPMLDGLSVRVYCTSYAMPSAKWRIGNCPMATHLHREGKKQAFVDPLKASKKSMKGRSK